VIHDLVVKFLTSRLQGRAAIAATVVRIVTGMLFVAVSIGKFTDRSKEVADFHRFGVPMPGLAVSVVGSVELICGTALVLGLLTRLAALLLAADMVGAIVTAGRVVGGGIHLGLAPTLLVAMLFLLWAGPARFALDRRLLTRASPVSI
jgi:putative oxidoreductase